MSLTFKDVDEILRLIDRAEFEELRIEIGDLKLHVTRRGVTGGLSPALTRPTASTPSPAPPAPEPVPRSTTSATSTAPVQSTTMPSAADVPAGMVAVRAPMVGTFYRAPSPGSPPFVEVGSMVRADDTVCLIEVMKLFNTITAGVDGQVAAILVEDAAHVEHRHVLMLIDPVSHVEAIPE